MVFFCALETIFYTFDNASEDSVEKDACNKY